MPNVVSPTILVVDDERAIADTVVYALRTEGFSPEWCGTISAARTWLDKRTPALVVLDVGLPDGNGFDFCRELRRQHPQLPVIFLTARNELIDRVVGLEIGGDDYLAKPFSPRELTARVKAVLRRPPMVAAPACAPMAMRTAWRPGPSMRGAAGSAIEAPRLISPRPSFDCSVHWWGSPDEFSRATS